jgi:Leu/Phe-tRNA-protein transferase
MKTESELLDLYAETHKTGKVGKNEILSEIERLNLIYQLLGKFNYLDFGALFISEENNPDEAIDIIINTYYPYEFCIGVDFKVPYLINLIKNNFYVMSEYYKRKDMFIMVAMHHLTKSVLFFDRLHIKKSIKKYLPKYELRVNAEFEKIVDKCIEIHDDKWLTKPLVDAIKEIYRLNNPDATFISFGLYIDDKLIAGEFGTKVGRIYSSYSGYREESNSGTVQMILTAQYLEKTGYAFWDLGMSMDYKKSFGAKVRNHEDFMVLWRKYSIQAIGLNSEIEKYPIQKRNLSEEQLLWLLRNAYKYFYIEDLEEYLLDDFHYISQNVFEEITTKEQYLEYLKDEFKTIQEADPPDNEFFMEMVYDSHSNKPYLYMKQIENDVLFAAEVKDGKLARIDLCAPESYSIKRKADMEILNKEEQPSLQNKDSGA